MGAGADLKIKTNYKIIIKKDNRAIRGDGELLFLERKFA